jgi:hypothetical protein
MVWGFNGCIPLQPMAIRRSPSPAGSGGNEQSLQRRLADLVARRCYGQAIPLREQALEERQLKRAEAALAKAMSLGMPGEPLYLLARLRLDQGQPEEALALLREGFEAILRGGGAAAEARW